MRLRLGAGRRTKPRGTSAKGPALAGHSRSGDQSHALILKNLFETARRSRAGKSLLECGDLFRIRVEDPFDLCPGFHKPVALAVDVAVVEMDSGDLKLARAAYLIPVPLGGVCHAVGTHNQSFEQM